MDTEKKLLSSILDSRGVKEIHVFHTDHWEPWYDGKTEYHLGRINKFLEKMEKYPHSRKLTLFYKAVLAHLPRTSESAYEGIVSIPGDGVIFHPQTKMLTEEITEVMGGIVNDSGHEIHLHVHHERYTEGHYFAYESQFVDEPNSPSKDSARLDLSFGLLLKQIENETGKKLENWGFVHGVWALNASDPQICNNLNEIEILMRNGCIADFTMPAGRPWVNPSTKVPFTIVPSLAPKCYEFPESDPTPVGEIPEVTDQRRFLIWNQEINYEHSSLDYRAKEVAEAISNCYEFLHHWLSKGFVIGNKMFIKTHAHSMHGEYDTNESGYPHEHPDIVKIFERLQEVCDDAGASLQYSTVNQVMDELYSIDKNLYGFLHEGGVETIHVDSRRFSGVEGGMGRGYGRDKYQKLESILLNKVTGLNDWQCLGGYYVARFENHEVYFSRVDLVILQYSLMQFADIDRTSILEFGPGIGSGLLLLSLSGFDCVGVEADRDRYSHSIMMKELASDIAMEEGFDSGPLKYHYGQYPDVYPELAQDTKVLMSTNVVSGHTAPNQEKIFDDFANFDHLIIDTGSFGVVRDEKEREIFEKEVISRGFSKKCKFFEAGRVNLVHFTKD